MELPLTPTPINLIDLDARGVAYIAGSRIKVSHIAIDATTWNNTPQEIQENYPHLSLAHIYAALSYYHSHKEEIDAYIEESDRYVEQMRAEAPNQITRAELEARLRQRQPNAA